MKSAWLLVLGLLFVARRGHSSKLSRTLESLDSVLQYLLDHPQPLLPDTVFGVVLAKGQLHVLLDKIPKYPERIPLPLSDRVGLLLALSILERKAEDIVAQAALLLPANDHALEDLVKNILKFDLWYVDRPMLYGALRPSTMPGDDDDDDDDDDDIMVSTDDDYATLLSSGTPNETTSNTCLAALLASPGDPVLTNSVSRDEKLCGVSHECWNAVTTDNNSSGYPLTHRLLFFQTARQLGCSNPQYFFNTTAVIKRLCSKILIQAHQLAQLKFPAVTRDLFTEQVALCGLEGYTEFLIPEWRDRILSWQQPDGCFGDTLLERFPGQKRRRVRRDDGILGTNCLMHMTGVATAALAVHVRAVVEALPVDWNE